jgi:hypothetical protein
MREAEFMAGALRGGVDEEKRIQKSRNAESER